MAAFLLSLLTIAGAASAVPAHYHIVWVMGRKVHVYKPNTLAQNVPRPALVQTVPGVFVLHGSDEAAPSMFNLGFEAQADLHDFLVIYPEMRVPKSDDWGYESDIPFFNALSKRLREADFGLDAARTFVCGHSAGGTMSLYLQNEVDLFKAGGAVEAAPGQLQKWDMKKPGHRSIVIWNHADPVLEQYAPRGGEPAYYQQTISTLRRHGSRVHAFAEALPVSDNVTSVEILTFPEDGAPELKMLHFRSKPGTHTWASTPDFTFDATKQLMLFFMADRAWSASIAKSEYEGGMVI